MKYWLVDAFADKIFQGNPAAVCVVPKDFDASLMQQIAAEFNLSETAFLESLGDNTYYLRWFTPKCEVNLCGHATLAASLVLFDNNLLKKPTLPVLFRTRSGHLYVEKKSNEFVMNFPAQKSEEKFLGSLDQLFDHPIKIRDTRKVCDDLIVEISSDVNIQSLQPNFERISMLPCRALILTAQDRTGQNDFISRFFAPKMGVNEDPVTGSAHCKLAPYWSGKLGKKSLKAYQASARGGSMRLELVEGKKGGEYLKIQGKGVIAGSGELFLA